MRSIKTDTLKSAVKTVMPIVDIGFELKDHALVFWGVLIGTSTGDVEIQVPIPELSKECFCVDSKKLFTYLQNATEEFIDLEVDQETLLLSQGRYKAKINTLDHVLYPRFQQETTIGSVTMLAATLRMALKTVEKTISLVDIRQALMGCNLYVEDNALRVQTTTGSSLSDVTINGCSIAQMPKFLITRKAVSVLIGLLEKAEQVTISYGEKRIVFSIGDITLLVNTIRGEMPSFSRLTEAKKSHTVLVNVADLISLIKRTSAFSEEKTKSISLTFQETTLKSKSKNKNGDVEDSIEVKNGIDAEVNLNFNSGFLLDVLNTFTLWSDEVAIKFNDGDSNVRFECSGVTKLLGVIK